jgi:hypothetical protein
LFYWSAKLRKKDENNSEKDVNNESFFPFWAVLGETTLFFGKKLKKNSFSLYPWVSKGVNVLVFAIII